MRTCIKVENLSKAYQIGQFNTGALSLDIERWWALVRGKEDPFLKIGEVNKKNSKGASNIVWSLKDINLEVEQGDVVGIIGKNGAGKSTLLKLLSRVTGPTGGSIKIKGRVASLLEVGTGFHKELTGRENIFLNGSILGMRKNQIREKFDEIVDFAGVERYVDTPVKRYSSGMYVRLAFAVAAHLESEILIVDEVLAVGDIEFQKKCLGKMGELSQNTGRTILFVSHKMSSIQELCSTAVVLDNGQVDFKGGVEDSISHYLNSSVDIGVSTSYRKHSLEGKPLELVSASVMDSDGNVRSEFTADEEINVHVDISISQKVPQVNGYVVVKSKSGDKIIETDSSDFHPNIFDGLTIGFNKLLLKIPKRVLPNGAFMIYINFTSRFNKDGFNIDNPKEILEFNVLDIKGRAERRNAKTNCIIKWEPINAK